MRLTHGTNTAIVEPEGGRLASLAVDGVELLVTEGERPTRWGSFPMVPWCGRLRDGLLTFEGAEHHFPLTSPPHANHGFGHTQPWTTIDEGPDSVAIRTELGEPWPFGGHVVQRFELGADRITVTVEVHAADQPMPAMAGWHPWFRRDLGVGAPAELEVLGGEVYATDDSGIPTGELEPVPAPPWDLCFVGLDADPVIRWPGALAVTLSSTFDHWVIFTEPEHALCVEPESGAPNDVNRAPHVVRPGDPLVGSMTIRWAPA
ncbi:MAG: hypothetical protein U0Q22_06165 [Acidimicrobiales bacterium]